MDTLQGNNVKPVLITLILVTKTYIDASNFNLKIKELNTQIKNLAISKKIELIDLNPQLTDRDFLWSKNEVANSIHFTSKAYEIWRQEIVKILEQEKI